MFLHAHDNYIVVHIQFGDHHNVTPLQRETSLSCAPHALPSATPLPPLMKCSSPAPALSMNKYSNNYVFRVWKNDGLTIDMARKY